MVKNFKTLRVAALLSVASGAAVLLVGLSAPAKAAEERLHSSSVKVYGLVPPGEGSKNATNGGSIRTASAENLTGTTTMKSGKRGGGAGAAASNEPQVEDPPMPTYDGNVEGNAMAGSEASGQGNIAN